ncbi:hypothetical protein EDD66_10248 [Mobilisporobacter senegalensis]|uniref:Uncharacterized protein n=1 Tax=Mobilisporobacter senegalensis TaxID=1329262 RepID=A0A3N1XZM2_9FIRM|nr:hypothetical protein [Mobilisporobacter senegalensis]ROR30397.1 hypothetical protein EDD66_10248 [Mobilisporobacter senegalensis]
MIWKIKKGILKSRLYHMDDTVVAVIQYRKGSCFIRDMDGKLLWTITEKESLHLTVRGGAGNGEGKIYLSKTSLLIQPPRAERLCLYWKGMEITMKQLDNREIMILKQNKMIGHLTGLLRHTVLIELSDTTTDECAALLYALADRMFREDDIEIV